jgi:aspartate kinase
MEELALTGLAAESGYAQLTLKGLPQSMQAMSRVLTELADAGVSVDMVANADTMDGRRHLQITIKEEDLEPGRSICEGVNRDLGGTDLGVEVGLSRVTLVGSGMTHRPGVYAHAFRALLEAGLEVHGQSTSAISISLLVDGADEDRTLQVLHAAFELAKGRK